MTVALGAFLLGATGQTVASRTVRLGLGAVFRPSTTALNAVSGILAGPDGSMGELTLPNATTLNVNPFVAVIQGTHSTTQGQYTVPNDTARTLAVTAQHASQFRRNLVAVTVDDSEAAGVASSAETDRARLHIIEGALSATSPAPLPTAPANTLLLGEIGIPPSGQTVTLTPYNPRTTLRGGILPVLATDTTAPTHDGQARWHPTTGLEIGIAGVWEPVGPLGIVGTGSMNTSSPLVNSTTRTRISGTMNFETKLRAGRVYRAKWLTTVVADAANTGIDLQVSIYNSGATPTTSDPTIAAGAATVTGAGTSFQIWPVIEGLFRVNTTKAYGISPWIRRYAGTGQVQTIVSGYLGNNQWVRIEDLGSYAWLSANQNTNLATIPLVNI